MSGIGYTDTKVSRRAYVDGLSNGYFYSLGTFRASELDQALDKLKYDPRFTIERLEAGGQHKYRVCKKTSKGMKYRLSVNSSTLSDMMDGGPVNETFDTGDHAFKMFHPQSNAFVYFHFYAATGKYSCKIYVPDEGVM